VRSGTSDIPEFAQFLVEEGIDSISFNPDALIKGLKIFWQPKKIRYGYKKKIKLWKQHSKIK
jgi:hypothetical protein